MATSTLQLQILLVLLILISLFISGATTTADLTTTVDVTTTADVISPSPENSASFDGNLYTPPVFASILYSLGFQELSTAAAGANLSTGAPITIFAPADSSLLTCRSCSPRQLLHEHSVPGLYPLEFLRKIASGTKIQTLAENRCLTITTSPSVTQDQPKVFVNGAMITQPDLFYNGVIVVHGIQGLVAHLSPMSCSMEHMNSLSFPPPSSVSSPHETKVSIMRLMLKDAVVRLESSRYRIVALAMRVKFAELSKLNAMTVFALEDSNLLASNGFLYLSNFRFHVVPNRRILAPELLGLPTGSVLPTMDSAHELVLTTGGEGGTVSPIKINYISVPTLDLIHNSRIVIHAVSSPFPHMYHHKTRDGFGQIEESRCDLTSGDGVCNADTPTPPAIKPSTAEGYATGVLD
ncbi:fasciclin-like arabinogalactan protein 21 [Ipomoea triloba]|uniref:fasciclin-like arabinogalactan protein 21 n=1 Tax=Ipomoea triloba TaxID=35885 RepID=UPI00125CEF1C|nr:fasciclin-like arabinogalactan protein 21 [Ipomoea triloba]